MKHDLIVLGKTKDRFIETGISVYISRLAHYTSFELRIVKQKGKAVKIGNKQKEGELLLHATPSGAIKVVLDGRGRQFSSEDFAEQIRQWEVRGVKQVCYLVGGPEGHSEDVIATADLLLSFSKMTFTHDMIRMLFVEQLYRAYTIISGEKYHK